MTCRILCVLLVASAARVPGVAAQRAMPAPHASVLFSPAPETAADSTNVHPTYWKEGALLGGIPVGLAGYLLFRGLCDQDDTPGGGKNCGLAGLGGAVLGFFIGAIPGALIGGQIEKLE